LVVGTKGAKALAELLGATLVLVPEATLDLSWSQGSIIEEWRTTTADGDKASQVVVAVWPESPGPMPLLDEGVDDWLSAVETPFALWFAAVNAATAACADHGRVVVVVDRPNAKDAAGWGAEAAVADAVEIMAKSMALIHGERGVRINVVSTPDRLQSSGERNATKLANIAGAVTMFLSDQCGDLTGTAVHLGGES
jgi:NAD(P)-dependent dehydrogenase (short-subunit alcohol dehydrogenase family)